MFTSNIPLAKDIVKKSLESDFLAISPTFDPDLLSQAHISNTDPEMLL